MFNNKERKSILKDYNEFYEAYFEGINKKNTFKLLRFFREKISRKNKSNLINLEEIYINIYNIYHKMSESCLKYNKIQLKNNIDSLSKRDQSNFIILIITIAFTLGITVYTFIFTIDLQSFYTEINQSRENINKIEERRSAIKEIENKIKVETDKEKIRYLEIERNNNLSKISSLDKDMDNNLKSFNNSLESLDEIFFSHGKHSIYAFLVAFIIITAFMCMYKDYQERFHDNKKSFLLFCLYILEEVQDKKLKELNKEEILAKEEAAATHSNEVIEKLDFINEKINEVDKKVEDLKKFHDIK